jgi:AcrR family transcriptional regulator
MARVQARPQPATGDRKKGAARGGDRKSGDGKGGDRKSAVDRGGDRKRGDGDRKSRVAKDAERPLRKDAERNRRRILAAARELFAEQGLGVTLNDIAHHAGVGVGTVYRRFPDKAQLIEELFEQQIGELVVLMEEALEDPDPWQGITGFLRRNLELQARDRAFREIVIGSPEGAERVGRIRARMFPLGGRLVQRAKDAGVLRADFQPGDLPILILMLTAIVDAAREVEPDLWRRYLDVVIQGLRAAPTPPDTLTTPPLSPDQVPVVMAAFKLPRR